VRRFARWLTRPTRWRCARCSHPQRRGPAAAPWLSPATRWGGSGRRTPRGWRRWMQCGWQHQPAVSPCRGVDTTAAMRGQRKSSSGSKLQGHPHQLRGEEGGGLHALTVPPPPPHPSTRTAACASLCQLASRTPPAAVICMSSPSPPHPSSLSHAGSGSATACAPHPPHPPDPLQTPHHTPHTHTSPPPHRRATAPHGTHAPPAPRLRARPLTRTQSVCATPGRRVRRGDRGAGA
jgi:hypothetical protein